MRIDDWVEVRNQALALTVAIPGSALTLHHRSDRGPGRRAAYRARLPLPGRSTKAEPWTATVRIADRVLTEPVVAAATHHDFEWDGTDAAARPVRHARVAVLEARADGDAEDGTAPARRVVRLGRIDPRLVGLGGWTLSVHDLFDPATRRVTPGAGGVSVRTSPIDGGPDAPVASAADEILVARGGGRGWAVFGPEGHRRTVDTASGVVQWSFTHDDDGYLTSATDRLGRTTTFTRDDSTITIADRARGLLTIGLDEDGWATGLTAAGGTGASFRVEDDHIVSWDDAEGRATEVAYDDAGRLVSIRRPHGPSFALTRSVDGDTTRITQTFHSGREAAWTSTRPARGQRERVNDCCGNEVPLVSRRDGDRDEIVHPDGTRLTRSGRGTPEAPRVTVVETPGGIVTTDEREIAVDPRTGAVVETRTTNGRRRTTRFHRETRRVTAETPEGRRHWLQLDEVGRVVREGTGAGPAADTDPAGDRGDAPTDGIVLREITFDDDGRPARIATPDGEVRTTFDRFGRPLQLADGAGATSELAFDDEDRLVRQSFGPDAAVSFVYDATDAVVEVRPPGRPATRFAHQGPHGVSSVTFPATDGEEHGARIHSRYDDDGNLVEVTRADGRRLEFTWDLGNRNTAIHMLEGDGTTASISRRHEPSAGRLVEATNPEGDAHRFGWDGRLLQSVECDGIAPGRFRHEYDTDQRVVSTVVDGGHAVARSYDRDGLSTRIGPLVLERDRRGDVVRRRVGAVTESVHRRADGRAVNRWVTVDERELLASTWTYDAAGRLSACVDRIGDELHEQRFVYDELGRLAEYHHVDGTDRHTYDTNGNRLEVARPDGTVVATYDERDRLVTHDGIPHRYNADGELTSAGSASYRFDPLGRLTAATLPDGRVVEYRHDAFGRRIARLADGTPVARFLYDGALPLAEVGDDGAPSTIFHRRSAHGAPDAFTRDGTDFLVVADHVGSPRLVIDATTGQIVQRLDHDPWGRVMHDTAPGFQPFGFAGGLVDADTGLVHFGARDYDPHTARWLRPDPLLFLGGATPNLYCYADLDPVNHWDPTGNDVWRCESLSQIPWQAEAGLKHHWAKTDSVEAGLGPHPVEGGGQTAVTDQTGYSEKRKDTTCEKIENVDEECVNARLRTPHTAPNGVRFGDDLGYYSPWNQCQSFIEDVLSSCAGTDEFGGYDTYFNSGEFEHAQGKRWEDYSPVMDHTPDPGYTPDHEESSSLWD